MRRAARRGKSQGGILFLLQQPRNHPVLLETVPDGTTIYRHANSNQEANDEATSNATAREREGRV